MAEKAFGVKEINLLGSSGTPTIQVTGDLDLKAENIAISTNVSVGKTVYIGEGFPTAGVGIGTTILTDTANDNGALLSVAGIITCNKIYSTVYGKFTGSSIDTNTIVGSSLSISGISTIGKDFVVTPTTVGNGATVGGHSGVVTYYGDGQYLSGITADATQLSKLNVTGIATLGAALNSYVELYHGDEFGNEIRLKTTGIGISLAGDSVGGGNTVFIEGPEEIHIDPSPSGVDAAGSGKVRIKGDLYVDGTEFIINSETITLGDFVVGIATTVTSSALTDGAGIGIGSAGHEKTFKYEHSSTSLKSSENLDLANGKAYKINGTTVLNGDTLGTNIVNSSLTSIGNLGNLSVTTGSDKFIKVGTGLTVEENGLIFNNTASNQGIITCYKLVAEKFTTQAGTDIGAGATSLQINYANRLLYQKGQDYTEVLPEGTQDWVLMSNGSNGPPSWTQAAPSDAIAGLTISQDGSNVGPANAVSKLNFVGAGVTHVSGGIGTITIVGGLWVETDAGIHTLSNVGLGTTNPEATLHLEGETPLIFAAAGAASTQRISVAATTTNNGSLSFEGSEGQLFSITNDLTEGPLFAVNDVSGIPVFNVDADGTTTFGIYGTGDKVGIGTSTPVEKLTVVGVVSATQFYGAWKGGTVNATAGVNTISGIRFETVGSGGTVGPAAAGGIVTYHGDGSGLVNLTIGGSTAGVGVASVTTWTLTAPTSSAYRFDGPGVNATTDNPHLVLQRGQRYDFKTAIGSHPFKIQITGDDANGTEWTDGVSGDGNGVTNGTLVFTVPFTAPDVLYYQCGSHDAMSGTIWIGNSSPGQTVGYSTVNTSVTVGNGVTISSNGNIESNGNLTLGGLTQNRLVITGANGLITTDSGLSVNATNDTITATTFSGSASAVGLTADTSSATDHYLAFMDSSSGTNKTVHVASNLKYQPSTGTLTAGKFAGDGELLTNITYNPFSVAAGITSTIMFNAKASDTLEHTFPSTSSKRYLIHSMHCANIGIGTTANITMSIDSTGSTLYSKENTTYIAYQLPVPADGVVELLDEPIVMNPYDKIKCWSTNNDYVGEADLVDVYINYAEVDNTNYYGVYASDVGLGVTDTQIGIYTSTDYGSAVESVHLTNVTNVDDYAISVGIASGGTKIYWARNFVVPRYSTVQTISKPKLIPANHELFVEIMDEDKIDVIVSILKRTI